MLASASSRRQKILKERGFKFKVLKSRLNEKKIIKRFKKIPAKDLVKILALLKALKAGTRRNMLLQEDKIIAGFDTIVVCKGKIIDKPNTKKEAVKKLLFLSNKKHEVYTGIALVKFQNNNNKKQKINKGAKKITSLLKKAKLINKYLELKNILISVDSELTYVSMKRITKEIAHKYAKSKEPIGKAGAYAIQGKGKELIKKIKGGEFNVKGLPIKKFQLNLTRII